MVTSDDVRKDPQTALITGASSGIGADLARLFARDRYDLVLVARNGAKLQALSDELRRAHGIRAAVMGVDLAVPGTPENIARRLREQRIRIDVLVNNAGFGVYGPFGETDLEVELRMLQVNIVSLTHLTKLLLPGMLARRSGKILNLASTAAFQPGPLMAVYYASKAYVLHFSEALARELADGSGITVTALCPGPTRTAFQAAAGLQKSRLVRGGLMMDSTNVARIGYDGLMRGKSVVIPGIRNRIVARFVRILPRDLATRLVRALHQRAASTDAA